MSNPNIDLGKLNTEERLQLLERLWESLSNRPSSLPLTNSQRAELDRRLDDLESGGQHGIPWDEVLQQIHNRK